LFIFDISFILDILLIFNISFIFNILQINYATLKHLGPKEIGRLTTLFNRILQTKEIPKKWQHNLLYPIPKNSDWQHDLNQTRPIALLETVKKTFTKIINNRLVGILSRHQILSPLNWAGLP